MNQKPAANQEAGMNKETGMIQPVMKAIHSMPQRPDIGPDFSNVALDMFHADFQPRNARFQWREVTTAGGRGATGTLRTLLQHLR